ncbi:MAG: hypothetical protein S0880_14365 [Actinomycetota bacterium]|nr:hypothetical protein [Actinomycetota bacterium]
MTDIDDRLRSVDRFDASTVGSYDLAGAEDELVEAIIAGAADEEQGFAGADGGRVAGRPTGRGRGRRTVAGGLLAGAALAGGVAAAAGFGVLDGPVRDALDECVVADDAVLVASDTDADGSSVELWIVDSEDEYAEAVLERGPDGELGGGSIGCSGPKVGAPGSVDESHPHGPPWGSVGYTSSEDVFVARFVGRLPAGATRGRLEFTLATRDDIEIDEERITLVDPTVGGPRLAMTVEAERDGYFVEIVHLPPASGVSVNEVVVLDGPTG